MLLFFVVLGKLLAASACSTDSDCQLNGVCTNGSCICDAAWKGKNCGMLVLDGPGKLAYGGPQSNITSWGGGPPVFDPETKKWVFFVTEIANHCGLSEWGYMSTVVRTIADTPSGPFVREGLVIPTQAHNPYYAYDPHSQMHLIFHIGKGNEPDAPGNPHSPFKKCQNGTTPQESSVSAARNSVNDAVYSTPPHIHASKSLMGKFESVNMTLPDGHTPVGWGYDNPAPFIFENGTVLLLTRYYNTTARNRHIIPHDTIWLVRAPSYTGPWELAYEHPIFPGENFNEEDPCIWRDHRGNFHALFHFTRGHAWSTDGITWKWGGGSKAWNSTLLRADGTVETLRDAERPRVWVNPETGFPELFFVSSGGKHQPSQVGKGQLGFTVVQKIKTPEQKIEKPEVRADGQYRR